MVVVQRGLYLATIAAVDHADAVGKTDAVLDAQAAARIQKRCARSVRQLDGNAGGDHLFIGNAKAL